MSMQAKGLRVALTATCRQPSACADDCAHAVPDLSQERDVIDLKGEDDEAKHDWRCQENG